MRIPIFKGMNTKAQLQKVNVEISKTENDLANFKQAAQLEVFQHQTKYKTNLENMNIQKQNMKLAEDVLSLTTKKFENGMGSNIEVISAQNDLKTAQTNYLNALYEVAIAKTDLLKALGKN
jgi:outer membrane protein TolC